MIKISNKTLQDLEFQTILLHISELCTTEKGKIEALKIVPYTTENLLLFELAKVNEYKSSFMQDARIPNHGYDIVDNELKLLAIENTFIEALGLKKIVSLNITVNDLLDFFRKKQELYPKLAQFANEITFTLDLIQNIEAVIDRYGEVKNTASHELARIRKGITNVQSQLNGSFGRDLSRYNAQGYLDEIRETVVDNRRVLAVKAMYRRKVKGAIMGNSKTGSIVYIEPEATRTYNNELSNLLYEEREEVIRILKELTNIIRPYSEIIDSFQDYLSAIDIISAKTKYAESMNAILPKINNERDLYLRDAYHPLLYLNNAQKNEKTYPQTIHLAQDSRIIVISGPNAGGKSITLKTIGLLQIMLQSAMLIPVHEYSRICLFDTILTDIGDNQSIENHLSTYSYRLKNMNYFLRKCNNKTLFLIDEFGTGSDPELGGALAEAFLEVFYEREAFGIITTHYANLKMLANELPAITNANMMFDAHSLKPLFKLNLGEAGSSFTFEVAQKNGIPYSLINKAKKKVERGKIRFDKSIADLQKERSKLEKTRNNLTKHATKAEDERERLEKINERVQKKLEGFQELYDSNQRLIYLGNKVKELSNTYYRNKKKRPLIDEFMKIIEIENSKIKKQSAKQRKAEEAKKKQLENEAKQKAGKIRVEKQKVKAQEKATPEKPKQIPKVNDKVRMFDGKAVGTVDSIEKGKAIVNYGLFTTNVSLDLLELVERVKK
ncbi:endonuclease MutS2 [Aquimarina agarivorans]|uniref:endonuclease MutS2 n=1 Tax=Aquimarina agarivorans TaxID=980584 RepID=UPI000248F884|nr:DNA mismatch repair protein MutS [Aquimarina agarivorans]